MAPAKEDDGDVVLGPGAQGADERGAEPRHRRHIARPPAAVEALKVAVQEQLSRRARHQPGAKRRSPGNEVGAPPLGEGDEGGGGEDGGEVRLVEGWWNF